MAVAGNLRTMQLSELLQWLSTGLKTGTLVVRGAPGEKRIYFQHGRVTSSSSTLEREHLGRFLVGFGFITEEELIRALEVQAESKILLGKILVMIGAIKEEELADLIRLKAAETIYDIFLWDEGSFAFLDGEIPQLPMVPISTDVTGIVMEGLRRYDEWERIKTRIGTMRDIPQIIVPFEEPLADREKMILNAINGRWSVDQVAMETHNPDFHVAKFVFDLMESGHVKIVGERPELPSTTSFADAEEAAFADAMSPAIEEVTLTPPEPRLDPQEYILAPPGPKVAAPQDFARFLKRGPDSAPSSSRRAAGASQAGSGAGASTETFRAVRDPADSSGATRRKVPAPPLKAAPVRTAAPPPAPAAGPVLAAIVPTAIPTLTKPMEELMSHAFTPNEAFIVSRINGIWDVKSIARISPFPENEVFRALQKLHATGVITFK